MFQAKRRAGQSIKIGDDITVTVAETATGWALVGVEAPANIKIQRIDTPSPGPHETPLDRSPPRNERPWGLQRALKR